MATVRRLLQYSKAELSSTDTCAECYINANNSPQTFFVIACKVPHMVVWAKLKNYPHWPAKLMSIDNGVANVRFFGDHTYAKVPVDQCYLYSRETPNGTSDKNNKIAGAINVSVVFHSEQSLDLNHKLDFLFVHRKLSLILLI